MKHRTLPLSLVIGAALTIPSLAMAAPTETASVDMQDTATATTLETEVSNANNEAILNQSNSFQISETQTISRANINNPNQQPMAAELEAPISQQPMTTEIEAPADVLQDQELQTTEMTSQEALLDEAEDLPEVSEEDDQ
ncbi:hypothetical protein ACS8FD_04035 [Psychrobacter sp. 1U2]|uniref:hypothetical protein n=1 Tax=Psychrobacter sp. 1U2 TaxID=3453577 RepID=UPI003F455697